jgi:hypothetical protein
MIVIFVFVVIVGWLVVWFWIDMIWINEWINYVYVFVVNMIELFVDFIIVGVIVILLIM